MVFDPIVKTGRRGWQDGKTALGACVWPSSETPESWLCLQYLVLGTEQNVRMRWISAEFTPVRARSSKKREKLLPTGDTWRETPRQFAAPQSDGSVSVS